jgi:hypothetical protein
MADVQSITSTFAAIPRQVTFRRWSGIECRVSLFMMVALVLVAALVGAFFLWEGEKNLAREIRGGTMYVARELAALTADEIITGNRFGLYKKLTPLFAANEEILSGGALLYMMIYNHNCDLPIGSAPTEVSFNSLRIFICFLLGGTPVGMMSQ